MISHVVQTLTAENLYISYQDYVIDITKATTDFRRVILLVLGHFGVWGNSLFFICSAWFLLKATAYKKKKWFFMLVEIWTVSIIILIITYVLLHGDISTKIILKSVFPTLFANNWYMTCYLLFYPISPILNSVIGRMDKKQLFRSTFALAVLYIFLDFIKGDWFFPSPLILWVAIYFLVAYMQKYLMPLADNIQKNLIFVLVNAAGSICLILLTELGGLHIHLLSDKMTHWANNCNPFIIFMSIGMFNVARNIHFKSCFINRISSLSLLIYVIHENLILRTYFRPAMWNYIYVNFGYTNLIGWVFILTLIIFLFGICAAAFYSVTIRRFAEIASNKLYEALKERYLHIESNILEKF